ncbi:MAG: hemerythrin domain-containing protein [Gemmatimonadetes bacterium]|nr:hemerythrin domain-containing protein [Gemmatimonadota bacterium]
MGYRTVTEDPLVRFSMEHEQALAALDRLERAATALAHGDPAEPHLRTVREVCETLTGAVRQHNENEERALFPLLGEDAPVAPFVQEHVALRQLEQRLGQALEGPTPERDIPPVAHALVDLLRAHIQREDEVLFPMARALLGSEGLEQAARLLGG